MNKTDKISALMEFKVVYRSVWSITLQGILKFGSEMSLKGTCVNGLVSPAHTAMEGGGNFKRWGLVGDYWRHVLEGTVGSKFLPLFHSWP